MEGFRTIFLFLVICISEYTIAQEDSLRSALNALQQRQRDLDYDESSDYGYAYENPDDIAFLNKAAAYGANENYGKGDISAHPINDYVDDEFYDQKGLMKRISSSFRERVEEDREKQLEEFTRNLINLENSAVAANTDDDYLRELWERYYGNDLGDFDVGKSVAKRYYPTYGMENVGLRKRGRYVEEGSKEEPMYSVHHHIPRDDGDDYQISYIRNRLSPRSNHNFDHHRSSYYLNKRFPVSKRSGNSLKNPLTHEEKRSIKKQTDPKVEKDLSDIFGSHKKIGHSIVKSTTAKPYKAVANDKRKTKEVLNSKKDPNNKKEINKEVVFASVGPSNNKPLLIKKKSIDWSDYFGLDRRKKSDNGLDKEWLLERYHKAIAVTAKKRNADIAVQSYHNSDGSSKKENEGKVVERKFDDMESKLKNMEDKIVDDALKYTGAHEDETDTKEIQEVKDNIISRLAAAYSLGKMRSALEEYKLSLAKEKARMKLEGKYPEDYLLEKKRTSVPRKEAIDESREILPEADNNIKCANVGASEECHEQNYRTPTDLLEIHFTNNGQCPLIQRACSDVASIIGHFGHIFEQPCATHQMCLLCSNNSWFSPTQQCNMLFISKATELCKGNPECQKEAHRSVRYLLDINRSLQIQADANDECEISCPETDQMSNGN